MDIAKPLKKHLLKNDIPQKAFGILAGISRSSMSDYMQGRSPKTEKAVDIAKTSNDFELNMNIISQMFGIFKLMDGPKLNGDALTIDAFTELEEQELQAKYKKNHARTLLRNSELSKQEHKELLDITLDDMDAVIMRVTRLSVECEKLGVTPMELFSKKKKEYIEKEYMEA
ncbi:helix-turn-helix domain-containing protein [Companilactobacillus sp. DQM5]|uniref:helix-turn-helix domain-containing protein n=1 Tax=Companilactobacillus sp. DQM5 TaxID=3463359 RepID=UPI0040593925